jgi:uncharacterized protein (DUF1684 family)
MIKRCGDRDRRIQGRQADGSQLALLDRVRNRAREPSSDQGLTRLQGRHHIGVNGAVADDHTPVIVHLGRRIKSRGLPYMSVTLPPASSTTIAPAAWSQIFSR